MKQGFEKHETLFCMLLIGSYLAVNSFCIQAFGSESVAGLIGNTVFSVCLLTLVLALKKRVYYGLTRVKNARQYLYFLPLALIVSVNLWGGIHVENSPREIVLHILNMINVGWIEELIFRGFLFRMMEKNGLKSAIAVSALTFGAGHIINLFHHAPLIPTLMQIGYATATGYLFVILFYKSKSLVPCIITHCLVNSLSVFHGEGPLSLFVEPLVLTVVPLAYGIYLQKRIQE